MVRDTGISPLLVFFDATGTTDSAITGNATAFQDVTYTWNFGDTGASGTEPGRMAANPGHNSRNSATGGVAAHLYVTTGVDTAYVATVTAHSGSNTASCQLGVTAYDPAGLAWLCRATRPPACRPPGHRVQDPADVPPAQQCSTPRASTRRLGSAHFGSGKRVLFRCGDTFSGDNATLNGDDGSIGAYGGCEGTQTSQPIFSDTSAGHYQLTH